MKAGFYILQEYKIWGDTPEWHANTERALHSGDVVYFTGNKTTVKESEGFIEVLTKHGLGYLYVFSEYNISALYID